MPEPIGERTFDFGKKQSRLEERVSQLETRAEKVDQKLDEATKKRSKLENEVGVTRSEMRTAKWLACAIGGVLITGVGGILFAMLSERTAPPTEIEQKMDRQSADIRELIEAMKKRG